jgi:O-methyltransferase
MIDGAKSLVRQIFNRLNYDVVQLRNGQTGFPPDFEPDAVELFRRVMPFTMTTPERLYATYGAACHIARNNIRGAVVECGVWRGGSAMTILLTLMKHGVTDRDAYLYDTFEGMPEPSSADVDHDGRNASQLLQRAKKADARSVWCVASLDDVRANVASTGYPSDRVHLVQGRVEDTIPETTPESIALLRLDTDWYESTRHELQWLLPRVARGGIIIFDDYGHWQGARQAVDEYLEENGIELFLARTDYSGRIAVRL